MCNRLQMGAARTSDARETDRMHERIIRGGVLDFGRKNGSDLHPQRMCQHSRPERLQTTTGGDI